MKIISLSVSGTICPLAKTYNGHFVEYEEPTGWIDKVNLVLDQYKSMKSKTSMYRLIGNVTGNEPDSYDIQLREELAEVAYNIMQTPLMLIHDLKRCIISGE